MPFRIEPFDAPVGARIVGVDLSKKLDAGTYAAIHQAWLDYQVLVFPAQDLTEEDQIRFTTHWGEMPMRARYAGRREENRQSHPAVMLVSNIREDGKPIGSLPDGEMMFHSDGAYDEHPYRYTILHALEVPSVGGNTLFANMYKAYDTLPDDLKRFLATAQARHGHYAGRHVTQGVLNTLKINRVPDSWVHPVFPAHEETGRPVLYVSRLQTHSIVGMPDDESDAVLDELLDHCERDDLIYEHVWTPGDVVMWDNRCLNHARTDFPPGERRLLRRTTVQGVRPEAACAPVA